LAYRERDPRCVLVVVFETTPPFRGIEVRVDAELSSDGVAPTRPAIASRHPGAEDGRRSLSGEATADSSRACRAGNAKKPDLRANLPS
jgi:hypothetical protein